MDLVSKLKEFANLIGKIPDEKLAEMAGLTLEELATAKEALKAEETKAQKSVITPEGREAFAKSVGKKTDALMAALGGKPDLAAQVADLSARLDDERALRLELEGSHRALAEQHRTLAASHDVALRDIATLRAQVGLADLMPPKPPMVETPAPQAPADLPAGKAVKVIKNARIKGYQGKSTSLNYGDIITGEEAAFLLTNYPNLVKVYG